MNVIGSAEQSMVHSDITKMGADGPVGYYHCHWMLQEMIEHQNEWSYGKLCRWLGWIQCALVGSGCLDLEAVKDISRRNA